MSDIELVIKIPEELYTECLYIPFGRGGGKGIVFQLFGAIKDGAPLPKGHGRLKDVDTFISKAKADRKHSAYLRSWTADDVLSALDNSYAPTIIEADGCEEQGIISKEKQTDEDATRLLSLEQQSNRCDSCAHSEERDGSNCYECVKGIADNFEAQSTDVDCISRQAVIDKATSWDTHFTDSERYVSLSDIMALPPVTIIKPCEDAISREVADALVNILEKIRAEIEEYKSRQLTLAIGIDDLEKGKQIALEYVFAILDKYKAESEGGLNDSRRSNSFVMQASK